MRDAGEDATRDHTRERIEQMRLAPRTDRDEPVELALIRAIAAQYLGQRPTDRAHEARTERRVDEVQVGVFHLMLLRWPVGFASPVSSVCMARRSRCTAHR